MSVKLIFINLVQPALFRVCVCVRGGMIQIWIILYISLILSRRKYKHIQNFWLLIYTYMAHICKISCLQVAAFKIHGHFGMERWTKNTILLVKILKNRVGYNIKRFASLLLKFWHNTHFESKNMLKKSNFPRFPRFFGQKFPNRNLQIFFTLETSCLSR